MIIKIDKCERERERESEGEKRETSVEFQTEIISIAMQFFLLDIYQIRTWCDPVNGPVTVKRIKMTMENIDEEEKKKTTMIWWEWQK